MSGNLFAIQTFGEKRVCRGRTRRVKRIGRENIREEEKVKKKVKKRKKRNEKIR